MSGIISPLAISLTVGLACTAVLWLLARIFNAARTRPLPSTRLPLALRWLLPFASLLAPATEYLLVARQAKRKNQQLEAMELSPQVSAACWLALRLIHAVLGALLVYSVARIAGWPAAFGLACLGFGLGAIYADGWLQRTLRERNHLIMKELPQYLDLLTVCVEAGATLTSGVRMIVERAPSSPLRSYFETVLRQIRAGRPRAQAFVEVARQYGQENLSALAGALSHAETSGMSLGAVLRAQAEQRSVERFVRAEKLAMQAPVKMLGPLICCIFPCTFIVLAVPIVYRLLEAFGK
jgi:tight adherence protein C